MKLTTKSRYGTRLILDIAIHGKDHPVPLSDVARRQKISFKYLEQLCRKLKKAGLINSRRGASGGHMLARNPRDISVGDIVRTLEETSAITECAEEDKQRCSVCDKAGDCISRWVWIEASKAMFQRLDNICLKDLLQVSRTDLLN